MRKIFICGFLLALSILNMKAQDTPTQEIKETPFEAAPLTEIKSERVIPYDGSFQFVIKKGEQTPTITDELMSKIEKIRTDNITKKLALNDKVYVLVLSRKELKNKSFRIEDIAKVEEN